MFKKYLILLLVSLIAINLSSQKPKSIKIIVEDCKFDALYITEVFGKDKKNKVTLFRGPKNEFVLFTNSFKPGIYYIGTKSEKEKEILIYSSKENSQTLHFDNTLKYLIQKNKSVENNAYYQFKESIMNLEELKKKYSDLGNYTSRDSCRNEINTIRRKFINEHKNTLVAKLIMSELDWIDPLFTGYNRNEYNEKITYSRIDSFLYNIDLKDSLSLRLPVVYTRIMDYFDKAVHIKPDLAVTKIDSIFNQMGYNSPMMKYYLPEFENKYSFAFRPWVDTAYIHIAKKYYNKQTCSWLDESEIQRVKDECKKKEGSLIGKIIPDVVFQDEYGKEVRLMDIKANYIVLDFWRPECSHCTEAFPHLEDAWKKYNEKGVVFVAVCTRQQTDAKMCWDKSYGEKPHFFKYSLADVKGTTGFLNKFNVGGVPNIMILDENKKILDKKINPPSILFRLEEIINAKN